MEFTCLNEGKGYYFPPCHIADISGFRILFDCPLDLSSLTIFSPVPVNSNLENKTPPFCYSCKKDKRSKIDQPLDASSLIRAEPRYHTVRNLLLWDVSFIDIVLISSPMGMLGLPFLTRNKDFSAKVYATEAAARIGRLLMEDLVTMHKEFRQIYGPDESDAPQWMKWEELESLPSELQQIVCGDDGAEFGGWMSLYSAADVKACMRKVEPLKYGEESIYNGILMLKAFSSGLDIGSCNWYITGPKGSVSYISSSILTSHTAMSFDYKALQRSDVVSSSILTSHTAMSFDYKALQRSDVVLYSDIPFLSRAIDDNIDSEVSELFLDPDDHSEEMEKLDYIFSCSLDSINAGGSVLIPIGRLGIVLQLLEMFAQSSEIMKAPIYFISSVAKELIAYTNMIPEWLCEQRQECLYSGKPLFSHTEMLTNKRLHLFPAIHSIELLKIWQEPCIVFSPHWNLRLGPVTHLLRRWHNDPNSLLILEESVDANLALLPFKPMAMKVLQCSFMSGMKPQRAHHLLQILQPQHVLFPEALKEKLNSSNVSSPLQYYSVNETLQIPYSKETTVDIEPELACRLHYATLKDRDITLARLKGDLVIEQGKYILSVGNHDDDISSQTQTHS